MVHIGACAYMYWTVTACCLWHNVEGGVGKGNLVNCVVWCELLHPGGEELYG